jgi:hypothetical protein
MGRPGRAPSPLGVHGRVKTGKGGTGGHRYREVAGVRAQGAAGPALPAVVKPAKSSRLRLSEERSGRARPSCHCGVSAARPGHRLLAASVLACPFMIPAATSGTEAGCAANPQARANPSHPPEPAAYRSHPSPVLTLPSPPRGDGARPGRLKRGQSSPATPGMTGPQPHRSPPVPGVGSRGAREIARRRAPATG